MSSHIKNKNVTVSMITFDIQNLDLKVWTRKINNPQWNHLRSLNLTQITRQRSFKLTDIESDLTTYEIARIEHVGYNTCIGRNVMTVDDIEYFANLYCP